MTQILCIKYSIYKAVFVQNVQRIKLCILEMSEQYDPNTQSLHSLNKKSYPATLIVSTACLKTK